MPQLEPCPITIQSRQSLTNTGGAIASGINRQSRLTVAHDHA
jgi:hypothetical protein